MTTAYICSIDTRSAGQRRRRNAVHRPDEPSGSQTVAFPASPASAASYFIDASAADRSAQSAERGLLDHLPLIAGRIDDDGTILECWGAGLTACGLAPEALCGRNIHELPGVPTAAIREASAGRPTTFVVEWLHRGQRRHFECHVRGDAARGHGAVGFAFEVTDRVAAGSQPVDVGSFEHQLVQALDAERQRLGAELHDDIGQLLTGLTCLGAALAERLRGRDDIAAEHANAIGEVSREALAHVRALTRELTPLRLAERGLAPALAELCSRMRRLHGIDLRLQTPATPVGLPVETATHLLRIAQEAIANALRHGAARRIDVTLLRTRRDCRLIIADHGCGFAIDSAYPCTGSGLALMRHRAAQIGGQLEVVSAPDRGTRVEVSFTAVQACPHARAS